MRWIPLEIILGHVLLRVVVVQHALDSLFVGVALGEVFEGRREVVGVRRAILATDNMRRVDVLGIEVVANDLS